MRIAHVNLIGSLGMSMCTYADYIFFWARVDAEMTEINASGSNAYNSAHIFMRRCSETSAYAMGNYLFWGGMW